MSIAPIQKLHDTTDQRRCELINLYINRVDDDESQINNKKNITLNIEQATITAVINGADGNSQPVLKAVAQCQNICNDGMFLMLTLLSRNAARYPAGMISAVQKMALGRPLCKKLIAQKRLGLNWLKLQNKLMARSRNARKLVISCSKRSKTICDKELAIGPCELLQTLLDALGDLFQWQSLNQMV